MKRPDETLEGLDADNTVRDKLNSHDHNANTLQGAKETTLNQGRGFQYRVTTDELNTPNSVGRFDG